VTAVAAIGRPVGRTLLGSAALDKGLYTILFTAYLGLAIVRFLRPHPLLNPVVMGIGLLALLLSIIPPRKVDLPFLVFLAALVVGILVSAQLVLRSGVRSYFPVVFTLSSAGIALLPLRHRVYVWGPTIVFAGVTAYFAGLMLTGVDARAALTATTHNGISMMMLVACVSLYVTRVMEGAPIRLAPAVLTLIVCTWGIGRSGILSSAILLAGLVYLGMRRYKVLVPFGAAVLLVAYVTAGWYMPLLDSTRFGPAIQNYRERAEKSESRLILWRNYFGNLDARRVLVGANVFEDPWPEGEINEYNYHCSFIALHSQTGLMGLVTMGLLAGSLWRNYRQQQVLFFLALTVVVRWAVDNGMFFNVFDFLPLFFIAQFLASPRASKRASALAANGARRV
jgi:hypothetical protein